MLANVPLVEVQEHIAAPIATVWEWVNDIESYPELMEPVLAVEVTERGEAHRVAAWEIELKGCVMRWVEHEDIDPERYRIDYRQLDGDLAEFEGYWQLGPLGESETTVTLTVSFDVGTPMLREMLNPVAERAIRENSASMLRSLAAHAVGAAH